MTQARIREELRGREPFHDGPLEQAGLSERVRAPGQQDHRAGEPRPMRGPRVPLVRAPGWVERVGEQDQRKRRAPCLARIGSGQARDAPAEGMPADGEPQPDDVLDGVAAFLLRTAANSRSTNVAASGRLGSHRW